MREVSQNCKWTHLRMFLGSVMDARGLSKLRINSPENILGLSDGCKMPFKTAWTHQKMFLNLVMDARGLLKLQMNSPENVLRFGDGCERPLKTANELTWECSVRGGFLHSLIFWLTWFGALRGPHLLCYFLGHMGVASFWRLYPIDCGLQWRQITLVF